MDQDLVKKMMAAFEFGENVLQNPQDIAYWPSKNALAIADDSNGLVIFSADDKHQLIQHVRSCADASAVCYNPVEKCLVVSVSKAISAGDDTPGEFQFYNDSYKLVQTITGPAEPKIRYGYCRWVACDQVEGDLWVASGDNETAALWRYSIKGKKWQTIWKGVGDLEHPSILPSTDPKGDHLDIILTRWTEQENWSIQRWTVDRKKGELVSHKRLDYSQTELAEPWSAAVDQETRFIYSYDYKSGAIQHLFPPNYNKVGDVVGITKAGQWTSIDTYGEYVYVSSSDERCVRIFRKRR